MPEPSLDSNRPLYELLDQAIDALLGGAPVNGGEVAPLVPIVAALRSMPAEDFEQRLRSELEGANLERKATMPATATQIREGFRTVTPYLTVVQGEELIAFLKDAFGAEETYRAAAPAGFHAELKVIDTMMMIGSGPGLEGHEKTGAFHIYVPDCDAAYRRAINAGGTSLGEPQDHHYGERAGYVKDQSGNNWYIATRFASAAPLHPGVGAMFPFLHVPKARPYIAFLKAAFGAEELAVFENGGRVVHASVRIGDAAIEMGEASTPPFPGRFMLYVDNCDAWYARAIAAGATSVQPPTDQPYHHRTATVLDPIGQEWVPAQLIG